MSPHHESKPARDVGIRSTLYEIDLKVFTMDQKLDDVQSDLRQIRSNMSEMKADIQTITSLL